MEVNSAHRGVHMASNDTKRKSELTEEYTRLFGEMGSNTVLETTNNNLAQPSPYAFASTYATYGLVSSVMSSSEESNAELERCP